MDTPLAYSTYLGHTGNGGDTVHSKDHITDFYGNHANEKWRSLPSTVHKSEELVAIVVVGCVNETSRELDNTIVVEILVSFLILSFL